MTGQHNQSTISFTPLREAWASFYSDVGDTSTRRYGVTLAFNRGVKGTVFPVSRTGVPVVHHISAAGGPTYRLGGYTRIAVDEVRPFLDRLWRNVDRRLLGKKFNELVMRRTAFRGVIEHPESNLHVHLTWAVPLDRCSTFEQVVAPCWSHLVPTGTVSVTPDPDEGWGRYMTKDQFTTDWSRQDGRIPVPDDSAVFFVSSVEFTRR